MKVLFLLVGLLPAIHVWAAEDAAPSTAPVAGVPVETVRVTDQDLGLFERVRDTYLRAEKKGLIASAATPPETSR